MANSQQLNLLKQSVKQWNAWRQEHPEIAIDLADADLSYTDLNGANLSRANLESAVFKKSILSASFEGANLERGFFQDCTFFSINFEGANLQRANLQRASLSHINLSCASLLETNLQHANLLQADLSGANLALADCENACLDDADLSHSILYGTNLKGASLKGASFYGAQLHKTILAADSLLEADVSEAILSELHMTETTAIKNNTLSQKSLYSADPFQKQATYTPDDDDESSFRAPPSIYDTILIVTTNILTIMATLGSIIQGLDVIERRWREHKSNQNRRSIQKPFQSDVERREFLSRRELTTTSFEDFEYSEPTPPLREITDIRLIMDDGSQHRLARWIFDPNDLRQYINAFSDPNSLIRPLQVIFIKSNHEKLVINVSKENKNNHQLEVILSYLQPPSQKRSLEENWRSETREDEYPR